jgi:hypothetical protein
MELLLLFHQMTFMVVAQAVEVALLQVTKQLVVALVVVVLETAVVALITAVLLLVMLQQA